MKNNVTEAEVAMTVGCGAFDDGAWLALPPSLAVGAGPAAVGLAGTVAAGMDPDGAGALGALELVELTVVSGLVGGVDVQPPKTRDAPATSVKNESLPVRRMATS
ncbi:hypothetical protein [Arthrobacter sp. N199823]|uniref:hypothetical protein n=1 Tax=Arthrobacter sp. N199823 TaxID=2058895 RepID=UPI0011B00C7B|nr:hypothetical protein [Arthrobacter sp. N199823]